MKKQPIRFSKKDPDYQMGLFFRWPAFILSIIFMGCTLATAFSNTSDVGYQILSLMAAAMGWWLSGCAIWKQGEERAQLNWLRRQLEKRAAATHRKP